MELGFRLRSISLWSPCAYLLLFSFARDKKTGFMHPLKKQTTQYSAWQKKKESRVGKSCYKRNDIYSPYLGIIREIIWNVISSTKIQEAS